MTKKGKPNPTAAADEHKDYQEYNKQLRTWFVVFGIGGPALLLTQEAVRTHLSGRGILALTAVLFLIGAAAQILIAFVNKVECWCCYYAESNPRFARTGLGRFMLRLDSQFWIDVLCDVVSIAAFAAAVLAVFLSYV